MKPAKILGFLLKELQNDAQITDTEISKYLQITPTEYNNLINNKGEEGIDLTTLRKISDLYNIDDHKLAEYSFNISHNLKLQNTPEDYQKLGLDAISTLNRTKKYLKLLHGLNTEKGFLEIKEK